MFPRLRQQILARVDVLVELSTLGEYGVDEHGALMALDPEPAATPLAPRRRDRCGGDASRAPACAASADGGGVCAAPSGATARGRAVPARS